jgi:hypothetical protein
MTLRHIARESRTYVIGVTSCVSAADLPADLPGRDGRPGIFRLCVETSPRPAVTEIPLDHLRSLS